MTAARPLASSCDAVPPRAQVAQDVATWIERYVPRTFSRSLWESDLRPFVVPLLLELSPTGTPSAAVAAWALTRLGSRFGE